MSDFETLSLQGSGLERQPRVRPDKWAEGYLDRFDSQTLWLDAVWHAGAVVLICPRLNNLNRVVTRARFTLDGTEVRPRVARYYRHTLIRLPSADRPQRVAVEIGDWRGETAVQRPDTGFDGCNVLMTLSKDNDLAWIEDWARFHHRLHRADAALFVDNGSTAYGHHDIERALARAGLTQVRVLTTSLPFGPRGRRPFVNAELFLQTGVMNSLRYRFLSQARAVLACDIDELVTCNSGSIFDRAARSRFGYVGVRGHWVYPAPGHEGLSYHADHGWRDDPPRPCPQKWCLVPSGPLRNFAWRPHSLERLPLAHIFALKDANFFHCRSVTTGWKSLKRTKARTDTIPDLDLKAALAAADLPNRSA